MSIPNATYEDINERLAALGLPPLDHAELEMVHHLLSRMIGSGSRGYRTQTRMLAEVIAGAVTTACEDEENLEEYEPLVEQLPGAPGFVHRTRELRGGWPRGERALERLGLTPAELDELWQEAYILNEKRPELPIGVVAEFFPPPIWFGIVRLLACGQGEASLRIRRHLTVFASSPPRIQRSRPSTQSADGHREKQKRAQTGLSPYVFCIERFLKETQELARAGYRPKVELRVLKDRLRGASDDDAADIRAAMSQPSPLLTGWQTAPPSFRSIIALGATERTDRSAPPLQAVRREWAVKLARFGELAQQPAMLRKTGLHLYRDIIIMLLLVILGGRMGAIVRIKVCDVDFAHRFPDGAIGPAIRLYPGKTIPAHERRWKGIPNEMAEWLREYLAWTGLGKYPERRIFMGGWKQITDSRGRRRPQHGEPGSQWAVDGYGSLSSARAKRPLLPFHDERKGGYSPHTFRHLTEQLARRVGHEWISQHPEWLGRLSDQAFADALLDHSFGKADRLGYNDLEGHRETLARETASGIWELVFGKAGARRVPDIGAIQEAANARDRVRAELEAAESQIVELRRRRGELTNGSLAADEPPEAREADEGPGMTRALLGLVHELRAMLRQERIERRQIAALDADLDQAAELRLELRDELARADVRVLAAGEQTIPVDDRLSDEEYQALLTAAPAVEAEEPCDGDEPEIIHDSLPTKKFAEAIGVSRPTMRRWVASRSCPYWTPETYDEIILTLSERRRAVMIERLDHSQIPPGAMREIRRLQSLPA